MTQQVRVTRTLDDGTAQVIHVRQSACSGDCHKCSGCGAAQETLLFTAQNSIGARPGDLVEVSSNTGNVLAAAAVMYILPVVLFFLGYLVGELLWHRGGLLGCLAFAAGIGIGIAYDRLVAKKRPISYTITCFLERTGSGS